MNNSWRESMGEITSLKKLLLVSALIATAICRVTAGAVIYVDDDGHADFNNIQAAINSADNGDIIEIQPGTYTGDGNRDIDFKGKAITVRGATGDPNDCVIDCRGDINEPHRGFTFVSGEDADSVLEGLTITNGYAPKEYIYAYRSAGGAIYCKSSSPSIKNCIISNNTAEYHGGGICNNDSNPTLSNCAVSGNSTGLLGGGVYNYNSSPTIRNCTVNNNSADIGGGINNHQNCSPTISECNISNNSASGKGGGINNSTHSDAHITNSIISKNTAENFGGGIYNTHSSSIISICAISGNSAGLGGGIYNYDSRPNINNCTFSNNSSFHHGSGAGIHDYYFSQSNITNCTISNNSSGYLGHGIVGSFNSMAIVNNCIIWGNQPSQIGGNATVKYSDIQGGYTGVGNIDADPRFADPDTNDFHLTGVSLCIDTGDPNYISGPNDTDIDGDPRVIGRLDMGADEIYGSTSALLVVIPGTLDIESQGLNSVPQPKYISIKNYGVGVFNWQILGYNCNWLNVFPITGQVSTGEGNDVEITVNPNIAGYGMNSCQLQVTSPDAENSPQVVTVNLEVLGPVITVIPAQFYFETPLAEPNTTGQILFIQNTGYDTLHWQITIPPDCNWLNAYPMSGESNGEIDEVKLSVDANGMDIGVYICELTISDPNAENSPLTVPVSLHVYIEGQRHVPAEYPTIQAAVDAAVDGDEVIIEPGIYTGPGNYNIYFRGKAITVRSVEPNNPAIVAATIIEPNTVASGFCFDYPEQADSVIDGFTIRSCYGGAAIECGGYSSPTIRNCIIEANDNYLSTYYRGNGIECNGSSAIISNCVIRNNCGSGLWCSMSDVTVRNCIFTGNRGSYSSYDDLTAMSLGGGIFFLGGDISVINCTFSGNAADVGGGICSFGSSAYLNNITISNCIFRDNDANDGPQIALIDYEEFPPTVSVSYSDIQGGEAAVYVEPCCMLEWGEGNLDIDPCFAEPGYWDPNGTPEDVNDDFWVYGDYHLKSQASRWDPNNKSWIKDDVNSPCIDAGDPNSDWRGELWPHGKRINMGAYGGTPEASMSLSEAGNIADLNWDGCVGYADIMMLTYKWLYEALLLPEDLDRNGLVNFNDLAILAGEWGVPCEADYPSPSDGSTNVDLNADLSWTPGRGATSHDVYFGTSNPPPFVCNQTAATFDPGIMALGTTYYWRIDEVGLYCTITGTTWSFTTMFLEATNPNPADGATNVSLYVYLSWTAGYDATSHDVYFGTSNPPPFVHNQADTTFEPIMMFYSTTYYWRIDEVGTYGTITGNLWSFKTFGVMPTPPPPLP